MATEKKAQKREGNTASINLKDSAVAESFNVLKRHCQDQTPHIKLNNADVLRYAIIQAASTLSAA
jgi:hypothetical protein